MRTSRLLWVFSFFICLSLLGPPNCLADTLEMVANFDGGNSDTVVDAYVGMPGDGWGSEWKIPTALNQNVTAMALSSGDAGFNEVKSGGGSYLSYTAVGNSASAGTSAVTRQYANPLLGVDLLDSHTVEFTVRIDEDVSDAWTFIDYFDRYCLYDIDVARNGSSYDCRWLISAYGGTGDAAGADVVGEWSFYNGARDGSLLAANNIDTNIALTTGGVYDFTIVVDPFTRSYDATVSDGTSSFTATDLGWRTSGVASGGYLGFNMRNSASDDTRAMSLDNIKLTQENWFPSSNLIVNGDFEAAWIDPASPPYGWTFELGSAASFTKQTSPAIGGATSVNASVNGEHYMIQSLSEAPAHWCLDVDFAAADPGIGKRSFYTKLFHGTSYLMFKVEGDADGGAGDLYAYSDGYEGSSHDAGWYLVLDDAVSFSADVASDPLDVNHLQVIGHYNHNDPSYDIHLTDAYGTVHSVLGQTIWRISTPTTGEGLTDVYFLTNPAHSNGDYLIDNVELVEVEGSYVPGDADENGRVDADDAAILAAHWLQAGNWGDGDFNDDGIVNDIDATMMVANWQYGVNAAVPEPGTLTLLVLLGLSVLALRRGGKLTRRNK